MSCRRCSTCGISFPLTTVRCPVCNEATSYLSNVDVDRDWQTAVDLALAEGPSPDVLMVMRWRRDELARLGFTGAVLEVLVEGGTDLHVAADLIGRGCSVETAARILL